MAYEVVFGKQAWPNVSMSLMASVKHGLRPEIPVVSDDPLSNLIRVLAAGFRITTQCSNCAPDIGCLSQSTTE